VEGEGGVFRVRLSLIAAVRRFLVFEIESDCGGKEPGRWAKLHPMDTKQATATDKRLFISLHILLLINDL
jgi:hypothetical protein